MTVGSTRLRAARFLALVALAAPVHAASAGERDPTQVGIGIDQAADAYDQATKAHKAGDFAGAARLFARADDLAPNAVALETALREALLADLPALGMALAERAKRQSDLGAALSALVTEAREKLSSRVGIVVVQCERCTAALDGEPLGPALLSDSAGKPGELRGFVSAGVTHVVEIRVGDRVERREIVAAPGATLTVAPTAPTGTGTVAAPIGAPITPTRAERAPTNAPPPEELDGIHPAWLTFGIAGTVALAAGSVGSYVDAIAIEVALQAKRDAGNPEGAAALAERGRDAEIRTYVLEGLLAGSAIATLGVAIFAVDWDGASPRSQLRVGPGNVAMLWRF